MLVLIAWKLSSFSLVLSKLNLQPLLCKHPCLVVFEVNEVTSARWCVSFRGMSWLSSLHIGYLRNVARKRSSVQAFARWGLWLIQVLRESNDSLRSSAKVVTGDPKTFCSRESEKSTWAGLSNLGSLQTLLQQPRWDFYRSICWDSWQTKGFIS